MIFKSDDPEISAKPVKFIKVAQITGKGFDEVFFWYPIAPPGYASLGCVVSRTDETPCLDFLCCPRMDLVSPATILEVPISKSSTSKAYQCWSLWKVENQVNRILVMIVYHFLKMKQMSIKKYAFLLKFRSDIILVHGCLLSEFYLEEKKNNNVLLPVSL